MKKILLTGGGTAGHIYPALAVAERLGSEFEIHFAGGSGMEKNILAKEKHIQFHQIRAVKLERKLTPKNLLIPIKLYGAISDAKKLLKKLKPDVVFSKGGFVSVPTVIAAKKLGIPIVSHESDLTFGLANKIILKRCNFMCTTFLETAKGNPKCIYTGQPIRKKVLSGDPSRIRALGKFTAGLPNLLVIGGSLGAKFINEKVWNNLEKMAQKFNVIHVTGKQATSMHTHENYLQIDYAENIGDFYAWANYILSRAGSGAINEFLTLRKPALLIPLSKKCSRGDQIDNAKLFAQLKIADMIEEENCDDIMFLVKLERLIENGTALKNNMRKMQNFDACDKIIETLHLVEKKIR